MSNNAIPNVGDGSIRNRMKIIPFREMILRETSRFMGDYRRFLHRQHIRSLKARKRDGEAVAAATATIANPEATADELREAFGAVSTVLESAIVQIMQLDRDVCHLRSELAAIKSEKV